jgi:hypothetical protein
METFDGQASRIRRNTGLSHSPRRTPLSCSARVYWRRSAICAGLVYPVGPACNGFIVGASKGWIATAAYCFSEATRPADIAVELWNGTRLTVQQITLAENYPVAFVRVNASSLQSIELSSTELATGDAVTQLAFTFGKAGNEPPTFRAIIGEIIRVGPMKFIGGRSSEVTAKGLEVTFGPHAGEDNGTAGAPLLDRQGKVAA